MRMAEGRLTPAQEAFAKHYAKTQDAKYAASQAGYSAPSVSAWQLLQNPTVMARAQQETQKILAEAQTVAAATLLDILRDPKASHANKIKAASVVLDKSGYQAPSADGAKEAHEMTPAEVAAELDRLRAQADALETVAASNARLVEDVEPIDEGPAADLFG